METTMANQPPHANPRSPVVAPANQDADRQLSSAQLQELEELRYQLSLRDLALDSTPTHFVVSKVSGAVSEMIYCNRAVTESLGYQRHELIGKSEPIGVNWKPEQFAEARALMTSGQDFRFEDEVSRRDGSTFWTGVTVRPIMDEQGRMTHTMAIGADITTKRESQRKERELQEQLVAEMKERERILIELRTAQKLESVGRLAAGVAHEINTPIQYVGDSLYFLRSSVDDLTRLIDTYSTVLEGLHEHPGWQAARDAVAVIAEKIDLPFLLAEMPKAFERTFEGTDRVSGIVRAMKEFSHPDATEFSSADLTRALQTTLVVATNEYKYLATVHTEFAELPPVSCNVGELNQVFLNMIVNAAHAIHDAGKDVSTGVISIRTALVGEQVEITFNDNGCGIPQENLDKIYDPFFTTKEVGRGTGQGLAITRSIVMDKHGGEVHATSEVGVGTQFVIRLPITGRSAGGAE
jgi:PAS domain S-box-containing protein